METPLTFQFTYYGKKQATLFGFSFEDSDGVAEGAPVAQTCLRVHGILSVWQYQIQILPQSCHL